MKAITWFVAGYTAYELMPGCVTGQLGGKR